MPRLLPVLVAVVLSSSCAGMLRAVTGEPLPPEDPVWDAIQNAARVETGCSTTMDSRTLLSGTTHADQQWKVEQCGKTLFCANDTAGTMRCSRERPVPETVAEVAIEPARATTPPTPVVADEPKQDPGVVEPFGERWVIACRVDQMDDKVDCALQNEDATLMVLLHKALPLTVIAGKPDHPGKAGPIVRVDKNRAVQFPSYFEIEHGAGELEVRQSKILLEQLLRGKKALLRWTSWPDDAPTDGEVDLEGFPKLYAELLAAKKRGGESTWKSWEPHEATQRGEAKADRARSP